MARPRLVDASVPRWYHRVTGRVRRVTLLGEGSNEGKPWIQELAETVSFSVGGFSVLDDLLPRPVPEPAT